MRTFALAFLAAYAPVLAQTNYGTITFTNKSGDVISNAVVTMVEASNLTYRYSVGVGGGVVPLADLPEGLRARFGYSPDGGDNAAALQRPAQPTEADRKKFEEIKAKAESHVVSHPFDAAQAKQRLHLLKADMTEEQVFATLGLANYWRSWCTHGGGSNTDYWYSYAVPGHVLLLAWDRSVPGKRTLRWVRLDEAFWERD